MEDKNGRWITLENGTHIFVKKNESVSDAITRLQTDTKHAYQDFAKKPFPKGKDYDFIELNNINFEKITRKEMIDLLNSYKKGESIISRDDVFAIEYNDGKQVIIDEQNDEWPKLTNIKNVIYSHENGYMFTGKDISIVNYKDLYDNWDSDDYRVEFDSDLEKMKKEEDDYKNLSAFEYGKKYSK